jgi:hypothetical protein
MKHGLAWASINFRNGHCYFSSFHVWTLTRLLQHRSDDSACWKSALAHRVIVDESILRPMNISSYLAAPFLPPLQPFTVKYNALAYCIPSLQLAQGREFDG